MKFRRKFKRPLTKPPPLPPIFQDKHYLWQRGCAAVISKAASPNTCFLGIHTLSQAPNLLHRLYLYCCLYLCFYLHLCLYLHLYIYSYLYLYFLEYLASWHSQEWSSKSATPDCIIAQNLHNAFPAHTNKGIHV